MNHLNGSPEDFTKKLKEILEFEDELYKKDPKEIEFWDDVTKLRMMCEVWHQSYLKLSKRQKIEKGHEAHQVLSIILKIVG